MERRGLQPLLWEQQGKKQSKIKSNAGEPWAAFDWFAAQVGEGWFGLLNCCGLWAGPPANAPQQRRQHNQTNQPIHNEWSEIKQSERQTKDNWMINEIGVVAAAWAVFDERNGAPRADSPRQAKGKQINFLFIHQHKKKCWWDEWRKFCFPAVVAFLFFSSWIVFLSSSINQSQAVNDWLDWRREIKLFLLWVNGASATLPQPNSASRELTSLFALLALPFDFTWREEESCLIN